MSDETEDARDARALPNVLFRDDFAAGALDLSKWTPNWLGSPTQITPPVNGAEVNAYDPAQVTVENEHLVLRAAQRNVVDSHGTRHQYVSGCVTTHGKASFTPPVKIRARILLPGTAKGDTTIDNWPAFWCDGEHWPHDGELDIVEGLGGHAAYHFHSDAGGPGGGGALDPGRKWHLFEADWHPDRVDFLYDKQHVGTISNGITSAPMYLVCNLALSASISPPVRVPSEMLVDFVEVVRLT